MPFDFLIEWIAEKKNLNFSWALGRSQVLKMSPKQFVICYCSKRKRTRKSVIQKRSSDKPWMSFNIIYPFGLSVIQSEWCFKNETWSQQKGRKWFVSCCFVLYARVFSMWTTTYKRRNDNTISTSILPRRTIIIHRKGFILHSKFSTIKCWLVVRNQVAKISQK